GNRFRLYRYDPLGCGLSDREVNEVDIGHWVEQLERVVDAAGLERFALLGMSQGAGISIAYAAKHPERVSHLILYGGYARGTLLQGDAKRIERFNVLGEMVRVGWGQENGVFRLAFGAMFMPEGSAEQFAWFDELATVSMSAENAAKFRHAAATL